MNTKLFTPADIPNVSTDDKYSVNVFTIDEDNHPAIAYYNFENGLWFFVAGDYAPTSETKWHWYYPPVAAHSGIDNNYLLNETIFSKIFIVDGKQQVLITRVIGNDVFYELEVKAHLKRTIVTTTVKFMSVNERDNAFDHYTAEKAGNYIRNLLPNIYYL
ncbi:MAG: hypothetical protein V4538_01620 [Bacteroidota bacterium]